MRRSLLVFFAVFLVLALSVTAFAAPSISSISSFSTVSADGHSQVNLTVTLDLDAITEDLTFPVPKDATRIALNGSRVSGRANGDVIHVDLSKTVGKMTGTVTFTVSYQLGDKIADTETGLVLQLPLLSGFSYPVKAMEFSITLPGEITAKPAFSSGYHQTSIEQNIFYSVSGATVSGRTLSELKDHETLEMLLPVNEEMFPQNRIVPPSLDFCNTAILITLAVALLYWIFFLRCVPPLPQRNASAPEGYTAGELGSILCGTGTDLTMMVLSWAQLGYLTIDATVSNRIVLYKRMEMGNERSSLERKCFEKLFGKRMSVDTTTLHYADLCTELGKRRPALPGYFRRTWGNPKVFRLLCAVMALFSGVGLGIFLASGTVLQWFWGVVLAILAFFSGLRIQRLAEGLFLRNRALWKQSLVLCLVWLVMGLLENQFGLAAILIFSQLIAGFFCYFGGRRTAAGKAAMAEILGLRRYLRTAPKSELQRITELNPEFFHSVLPYAFSLGVERRFSSRFGKIRIPACPYIVFNFDGAMTASEWCKRIGTILYRMEDRRRNLPMEQLIAFLYALKK